MSVVTGAPSTRVDVSATLLTPSQQSKRERETKAYCDLSLQQYKLDKQGWTFVWSKGKSTAGVCRYNSKQIAISHQYALKAPWESVKNTVLHEIAHSLVGIEHRHDAVWKAAAQRVGCTGERCHTVTYTKHAWSFQCVNKCWSVGMHRRTRANLEKECHKCQGRVEYVRAI